MKFKATDFDLVDIKYEISILKRQLDFISDEYKNQKEKSKNTTDKELEESDFDLNNPGDQAEYWYIVDEHRHLINDILPRILVNPFVVSLWSLYETAIKELAGKIKIKESVNKDWYKIEGPHFTAKIKKYFEKELNFPANFNSQLLNNLKTIVQLRNVVAHHNSRLNSIEKSLADRLKVEEINGIEISRGGDIIVIKPGYANRSFDIVRNHLNNVMEEYEYKYI